MDGSGKRAAIPPLKTVRCQHRKIACCLSCVYLKQNPTPLLHGRLFGMRQSKATQWIHVLLPVLGTTLRTIGDAPSRSVEALHARLGLEVPALSLDISPAEAGQSTPPPVAPLFVMTAPSDPSRAPTTRLNRKHVIAARKSGTC